jgi:hypothetical protein
MALIIFIICYLWIKLAEIVFAEPPLRFIKIVSYIVALVLVVLVSFGPIRIG